MNQPSSPTSALAAPQARTAWHALDEAQTLESLGVSRAGLERSEAERRRQQYGENRLRRQAGASGFVVFVRQFKNPLLYVLVGSGALAMAMGKIADGSVVLAVVLLNALIGFAQEFRAGKAIEALSEMVPEVATVTRAGERQAIAAHPPRRAISASVVSSARLTLSLASLSAVAGRLATSPATRIASPCSSACTSSRGRSSRRSSPRGGATSASTWT